MQVGHTAGLAHGDHLAVEAVVALGGAAAVLLPQPTQVVGRGAAFDLLDPLAVGVVGVGLVAADVLDGAGAILEIPGDDPPGARGQVAVAVVGVGGAAGLRRRVRLGRRRARRAAGGAGGVGVGAHAGLAGQVAELVVGVLVAVARRCAKTQLDHEGIEAAIIAGIRGAHGGREICGEGLADNVALTIVIHGDAPAVIFARRYRRAVRP